MGLSKTEIKRLKKYLHSYVGKTQDMFIKEMASVFGLLTAPPLKIDFLYSPQSDGYILEGKQEVVVSTRDGNLHCCRNCWKDWVRSRAHILIHEEAHNLHFLANEALEREERGEYTHERQGWSEQGYYLIETVAEFSTLVFYNKIGKMNNSTLLFASTYPYFAPAFGLFMDNRISAEGLLRKLIKMDVQEASPIINPYKHLLNSLGMSRDLYFGMCVKVENLDTAV